MTVKLANESGMGILCWTWQVGDKRASITWYEGCGAPIAQLGTRAPMPVASPERFGWKEPETGRQAMTAVRQFAQRFADQLAEES
jgi:hypothetical protein